MPLFLPIYLDHNATTPVDARVVQAMLPYFTDLYGNAASTTHSFGRAARRAVDQARAEVGRLIGCRPDEIVFTSGATESNNLAIKGIAQGIRLDPRAHGKKNHLITQATEHKAVLDPFARLSRQGFATTILPVDAMGRVSPGQLSEAIGENTFLVSIMYANNETGTIQPIREIGRLCRSRGVLLHVDATQAVGHIPVNVEEDFVDLLSLSAHKFYGPKGAGALYVRRSGSFRLEAQMDGGRHEHGYRSGTLNVPGIVGLGCACDIAHREMEGESRRLAALRDQLENTLLDTVPQVTVNGDRASRLPHTSNLSFAYIEGESLLMAIEEVAVSSGSACTSASLEPSHVLQAMGVKPVLAHSTLRFGLGRWTTGQEIEYVLEKLPPAVQRLRDLSPLYELACEGIDPDTIQWPARKHH